MSAELAFPAGGRAAGSRAVARHVRPQVPGAVWTRRETAVVIAAVLAAWAIAAAMWPLTGSVVPWDSKNHFYPMFRFLGQALADGELPLWNPYHFGGHPTAADPQSMLFTPSMFLFAWLAPNASMEVFDLVVFAHLLPGALAMLAIFARKGWRPEGAFVAALVFMLGGSASARLQHTGIVFGYGLYPLAFLLLETALDRRSKAIGAGFAVVASVMVLGRDQVAFLSGLSLIGFVAYEAASADRPLAYLRERGWLLATMGAIGAVLLAVPVLLTTQFLSTSTRPAFGFGVAAMGSLPPESLATGLFANVFGSLRTTYDYWGPDWHSLAEGTWTDRATNYLFVGTVPALLVMWHGIAGGRLLAREFRYWLIVGTAVFVYGLGRYTPAFSFIFDSLPGVSLYRRPADATFLINIVLAFSAGYLVHRYVRDGLPARPRLRRPSRAAVLPAAAVLGFGAVVASALLFAWRAGQVGPAAREIAFGLAAAGLAAAILIRAAGSPASRVAVAALLVGVTGAELVWRNAASPLNAEPRDRYAVFRQLPAEQARGLQALETELAARHASGEHPRVEVLGLAGGWQNAAIMLGLEDTIGYNPLRIADYERAIGPGENAVDPNLRRFPGTFRGYTCRMAGLLGLEYLVLDRPMSRMPKHVPRLSAGRLLYGSDTMSIYRLPAAAPRAYLATRLIPTETDAVLSDAELPEFDRRTAALVDRDQVEDLQADLGLHDDSPDTAPADGRVIVREQRRNGVELVVDTDRDAVVVLHDLYYPGWEARVDGKPAKILRTNLLFRGVEVGPGHHAVSFAYRPFSLANLAAAASSLVHGHSEPGAAADTGR